MVNGLDLALPGVGFLLGLGMVMLFAVLAVYIYTAIVLMTIAKRTKTPNGWLAWIPIANVYLMTQIAGLSPAWTAALLLTFIPRVGGLAFVGISTWWWWRIAEKRKYPGWYALLLFLPIVNFVVMGILAWGKKGKK